MIRITAEILGDDGQVHAQLGQAFIWPLDRYGYRYQYSTTSPTATAGELDEDLTDASWLEIISAVGRAGMKAKRDEGDEDP